MASDLSRLTFDPKKRYNGVLMQQGRVQLDADWNEQLDVQLYRTHTEAKDVIGLCGAPKKSDSFKISALDDGTDLLIDPGRFYAGGLLCEWEEPASYFNQPYCPTPDDEYFEPVEDCPPEQLVPPKRLRDGAYLVYLVAWQRERNYLDDPLIQEVALGGPDTTTRLQTVWQVKLLKTSDAEGDCDAAFEEWTKLTAPPSGKLNVHTRREEDPDDPCLLPPQAGYKGLENQLYRVEIQKGGDRKNATFKWSRDNGSVETKIEEIDGDTLTVADVGKDEILGFAGEQWVEIVDEESTLKGQPTALLRIVEVDPYKRKITLYPGDIPNKVGKLRRWDQNGPSAGPDGLPMTAGWIDIEDGIQILFSEGDYRAGDYWLIPARTATHEVEWPPYEIPNLFPIAQSPKGVHRHYCRLARLNVVGGVISVEDCRPLFPPLTDICAEDVCFDNSNCNLPDADNVQQALNLLCAANDLWDHNKHLHGHGVVCGLKLRCGDDRAHVIIGNGYALDCEGNVIQLRESRTIPIVAKAKAQGLLDKYGKGVVCLSIGNNGNGKSLVSIEKYVKKDFWEEVLEGSLLKNFYEECIENLILFLGAKFPVELTETLPVPVQQRRLTAFINLLAQLVFRNTGRYIFLSGDKDEGRPDCACGECNEDNQTGEYLDEYCRNEGKYEDKLLWCFYCELKNLIACKTTFCGIFDYDAEFPDYPLDPGLTTIFGPALQFHYRLKINPEGTRAYTCGLNNKIYVYDLETDELAQILEFPASKGVQVLDIEVTERELYAVGIVENQDSIFAYANISAAGKHNWRNTSVRCGEKFVRLGLDALENLYAIRLGNGLYAIQDIGTSNFNATSEIAFNATGLMHIHREENLVIVGVSAGPVDESQSVLSAMINVRFDEIEIYSLDNLENQDDNIPRQGFIPLSGLDFGNDIMADDNRIFATGQNQAGEEVVMALESGNIIETPTPQVDVSVRRLAVYDPANPEERFLLVSIAEEFKIVRIPIHDGAAFAIDDNFRIPTQLFPTALAIDSRNGQGCALNLGVNTITAMDMAKVFHNNPAPNYTMAPPEDLAEYRDQVLEAFDDLLSHFMQYLKDCFCDQFLIDCPECGPEDKVYLGTVEIRKNKVYNICNFTKRKYVKNVQTWEYWLSTFPVLPLFKEAFTKFCCSVLETKGMKERFKSKM